LPLGLHQSNGCARLMCRCCRPAVSGGGGDFTGRSLYGPGSRRMGAHKWTVTAAESQPSRTPATRRLRIVLVHEKKVPIYHSVCTRRHAGLGRQSIRRILADESRLSILSVVFRLSSFGPCHTSDVRFMFLLFACTQSCSRLMPARYIECLSLR
jgi:hypothetical protein